MPEVVCGYCGRAARGAGAELDTPACGLHRELVKVDPNSNAAVELELLAEARRLARLERSQYGRPIHSRR